MWTPLNGSGILSEAVAEFKATVQTKLIWIIH